ncbi:hypothetical protein [Sphaerisporangium sp. TRM90804]|uniref:hypothetical protein n=1 Tax=Sphaerisporangium sp. TRM90804 TaxID=3031113 RepID=UPI00244B2595|nr:hypothetical protein [Sphaerisporangium sp. TRM90804]MDH2424048.1 hypothetical protein [Sphaerisporangium sp. TRM90804]
MDVNSTVVSQIIAPQFIAFVKTGQTYVGDSRTPNTPHNVSTVPGYPRNAVSVALAPSPTALSTVLNVTVSTDTRVFQAACLVNPQPGSGGNPAWPANCGAFVEILSPTGTATTTRR